MIYRLITSGTIEEKVCVFGVQWLACMTEFWLALTTDWCVADTLTRRRVVICHLITSGTIKEELCGSVHDEKLVRSGRTGKRRVVINRLKTSGTVEEEVCGSVYDKNWCGVDAFK